MTPWTGHSFLQQNLALEYNAAGPVDLRRVRGPAGFFRLGETSVNILNEAYTDSQPPLHFERWLQHRD